MCNCYVFVDSGAGIIAFVYLKKYISQCNFQQDIKDSDQICSEDGLDLSNV